MTWFPFITQVLFRLTAECFAGQGAGSPVGSWNLAAWAGAWRDAGHATGHGRCFEEWELRFRSYPVSCSRSTKAKEESDKLECY